MVESNKKLSVAEIVELEIVGIEKEIEKMEAGDKPQNRKDRFIKRKNEEADLYRWVASVDNEISNNFVDFNGQRVAINTDALLHSCRRKGLISLAEYSDMINWGKIQV